jgi:dolichol-phosphate mannosyltransferase
MKIAVIIPCFKVTDHIEEVIQRIGDNIAHIYCVDDGCPDNSGKFILDNCKDGRLTVLFNKKNSGVGGAVKVGYAAALSDGMDILVKVDGDGQMDPVRIDSLVAGIINDRADYCKGNRFYNQSSFEGMPLIRIIGNAILSLLIKLSSGYWHIVDPTNGFTAIHAKVLKEVNFNKIDDGYFFESSMLCSLGLLGAVVHDVPIKAVYGQEKSNITIPAIALPFLIKNLTGFNRRIFIVHFLRGFSVASIELIIGTILLLFGLIYGAVQFAVDYGTPASVSAGVVMLSAVPILIGVQLILSFLRHDYSIQPSTPLHISL